jgi:hypothetical protein
METARKRNWADLTVLIVGLWTIAQAIWGPALLPQRSQDQGTGATYIISLVAGALALLGLWVAQRRRTAGRVLIAATGAVILIAPFTYQRAPALSTSFAILSGLLLLVASKFVGPLPPPNKPVGPEGAERFAGQRGR